MKSKINIRTIAFIGMLSALSAILMYINIPLPFAPTFLKFDIAELPALFAGFFFGPLYGFAVIVFKLIIKIMLQGTDTAFVGELMNLIGSSVYVLTAAIIYKYNHTKRGAIIALVVSTLVASFGAIFLNAYIAFPMYSSVYGIPMQAIVEMGSSVNPLITNPVTLMLYGVLPFNLIKHGVTSFCTYLIYKKCGNALRSFLAMPSTD